MKKQKIQFIILAVVLVALIGGYFLLKNRPEKDNSGDNAYTALTITADDVRQITASAGSDLSAADGTDSKGGSEAAGSAETAADTAETGSTETAADAAEAGSTGTAAGTAETAGTETSADTVETGGTGTAAAETGSAASAGTDVKGSFSLTYDGTSWAFADSDAAVDSDKADSILEALAVISGSEKMENVDSLTDYGLDSPSETVTVTMENGDTHTLSFGSYNELGDCYYFSVDSENTVYACSSDFYNTFQVSEDDLTQPADESTTGETAETAATQEPAGTEEPTDTEESADTEE